jgi:hypothetical protein
LHPIADITEVRAVMLIKLIGVAVCRIPQHFGQGRPHVFLYYAWRLLDLSLRNSLGFLPVTQLAHDIV